MATVEKTKFAMVTPPKVTVIQRSVPTPLGSGNNNTDEDATIKRSTTIYSDPVMPPIQPGEVKNVVDDITHDPDDRKREKTQINDLNDRLEKLLQRTRDAESANRDAAQKLKSMRDNLGKDTREIKDKYDHVLKDLKNRLEDSENKRGELEVRMVSLQSELDELRGKIDEIVQRKTNDKEQLERNAQRLGELKNEGALLERKLAQLEAEREKLKNDNAKLLDDINKKRVDLDQESIARIKAENHAFCLQEELEFLRRVWELERKELEKLSQRDNGSQNREFWRTEITTLQRELQEEFDNQLNRLRDTLAQSYDIKLKELTVAQQNKTDDLPQIREEVKRNRAAHQQLQSKRDNLEPKVQDYDKQLQDARDNYEEKLNLLEQQLLDSRRARDNSQNYIQQLIDELRRLLELKVTLENEITLYRKLLEEEERKMNEQGGQAEDEAVKKSSAPKVQAAAPAPAPAPAPVAEPQPKVATGEMRAKTTSTKNAKGNVEISDCAIDGKFVAIGNSGKKEEEITGWKIVRNVEGGKSLLEFTFPKIVLGTTDKTKVVKVWAKGQLPKEPGPNDLEASHRSWGLGASILTTLFNAEGEERATHNQKTIFTS